MPVRIQGENVDRMVSDGDVITEDYATKRTAELEARRTKISRQVNRLRQRRPEPGSKDDQRIAKLLSDAEKAASEIERLRRYLPAPRPP